MKRRIVDLPSAYADRLRIIDLGADVPQPAKSTDPNGRVRFAWVQEKQPGSPWEANMAPADQVGPATELTTLRDWDTFAAWYGKLLNGRSRLGPKLAAEVDLLTRDAKSPRDIIDILTRKVSRDVRYTGLEFGLAGFRPADCNDVWANGYGDCKDKANLLRAMLEAKGLRAYLALVNTEHEGKVDHRSPSHLQFNHAIVAVEEKEGALLFCDPTIRFGSAGVMAPSSGDRDVFLVNGHDSKWAHTPAAEAGRMSYRFDLALNEQGEISGWMTLRSEGYYATSYSSRYAQLDHDGLVGNTRDQVRGFFPAAEVIDVKAPSPVNSNEPFELHAFFIASVGNMAQGKLAIQFPMSEDVLPDLVTDRPRKTDFFLWRDLTEVNMHLELPQGIQGVDPPAPYELQSHALSAKGTWKLSAGAADASIGISFTASLVPPSDFAALKSAVHSLKSWLAQPMLITQTGQGVASQSPKAASEPDDASLVGFPMLATAEGQRDLLERRFPGKNDMAARKRALQRLVQYFPNDPATQFYSAISLASIQDDAGDHAGAAVKIESIVSAYRGKIEADWIAWGEYSLACAYAQDKHPEKAHPIFLRLAVDKSLSAYRRMWSGYQAAVILRESKPKEAIRVLCDTIPLDSSALPNELGLLTRILIEGKAIGKLRAVFDGLASRKSEFTGEAVAASLEAVPPAHLETVSAMIQESGLNLGAKGEEALAAARKRQQFVKATETMVKELKAFLGKNPRSEKSGATTPGALDKEIDAAVNKDEVALALDLTLQRLTDFPMGSDFSTLLWKASLRAEWMEKVRGAGSAGPIFPFLLNLCDRLPHDDANYYEAKFVLGRRFERAGDFVGAEAVFAGILADPQSSGSFDESATRDLGRMLEKQDRLEDALKVYLRLKSRIGESAAISDLMLRAVLIDLYLNRPDDALDLLGLLDKVNPEKAKMAAGARQTAALVTLGRNPAAAKHYWQASKSWQSAWADVLAKLSPTGIAPKPLAVPLIPDLSDLGMNLQRGKQARDTLEVIESLNLLASAARWEPALAIELASAAPSSVGFFQQRIGQCNEVMLSVLGAVPASDPEFARRRNLMIAAVSFDAGQPAACIDIASKFLKTDLQQDEVRFAMARVLGIASYTAKEQRNLAIAELQVILALDDAVSDRGITVSILARLYDLEGRVDEERELLKREIENPRVKKSSQMDDLAAQARKLEGSAMGAGDFSKFLITWMSEFRPPWYELSAPASLSDPLVKNSADDRGTSLAPQEYLKWKLLIACDESADLAERVEAWKAAAMNLFDLIPSQKQVDHFVEAILDAPSLSKELRAFWLYLAMYDSACRMDKARFDTYRANPLMNEFNEHLRQSTLSLANAIETDRSSITSIQKSFQELGQKPLENGELEQLKLLFTSALMLGNLDVAQHMYEQFQSFSLAGDKPSNKQTVSLGLLRLLKKVQRWQSVHEAMRAEVVRSLPPDDLREPPSFEDVRASDDQCLIDRADAQAIRLHRLVTSRVLPGDSDFWSSLASGFETGSGDKSIRLRLADIMLKTDQADADKAEAAFIALGMIDIDNPAERRSFLEAASVYRDARKWPATSKALRKVDIRIAGRTGQPLDFDEALGGLPSNEIARARMDQS